MKDIEAQKTSQSTLEENTEADQAPVVTKSDGVVPITLDWDSPEDPDNPKNWSVPMRVFQTATPAFYCFALTVGSSSYVPAIPFIQREYGVSRIVAILPLSLYVLGYVFGPIFAAPVSELYGRRNVYWATIPLLFIFTGIAGAAQSIEQLVIARFLAGAGGSGALAIGAGTVSDLWVDRAAMGRAALGFSIAPFLGPALGTLTGAYIIAQYDNDWRFSQWVILMICGPIAIMICFLKETSKSRILFVREQNRGVIVQHRHGDTKLLIGKIRHAVVRPLSMMFVEPLVAALGVYTGFAFAMMFSFFGSYNYVFRTVYDFNQKEIGLAFLGILVGFLLGVATFGVFDATLYSKAGAKSPNGVPEPEHRLYAAMLGSLMLPIGLFWFAWAPNPNVHWIVPVFAGVPFGWGSLSTFIAATTYQIDVYGAQYGSSALAANGILRSSFGAAFPLFTLQIYGGIGIHWAGSVFAFVGLALAPIPWAFFKWGHLLRERSRYVIAEQT
ncbi:putative polyamine transporter 4 [Bisporella sp. PMI_857]|nr:putative polyamine transporter 4 [Bisporella sp. PMI_857]